MYDDALGACIAINSQHPEERRRWSAAHGYAHFLAHRYKAEVTIEHGYRRQPESERFADAFARYFLMPTEGLTRRFNGLRRTQGKATPAGLCMLANYYGVSVEALTRLTDTPRHLTRIPTSTIIPGFSRPSGFSTAMRTGMRWVTLIKCAEALPAGIKANSERVAVPSWVTLP